MKAYKLIEFLVSKVKKQDYKVSYQFSYSDLIQIVLPKAIALLRGVIFYKIFLKKCSGKIFVEKGVKVKFPNKVSIGSGALLKENALINGLSHGGVKIGDNFSLGENAVIECTGTLNAVGQSLKIGNNVGINRDCYIAVRGNVSIGDNVIFGPGVKLFSENHNFEDRTIPIKDQGVTQKDVVLEDDIWLGANVSILPGIKIGKGSIIGTGSVVTKDIPPYSIAAGIPAKIIKERK